MLKRKLKAKVQQVARSKNGVIKNRDDNIRALQEKCSRLALAFHLLADDALPDGADTNAVLKRYEHEARKILKRAGSSRGQPPSGSNAATASGRCGGGEGDKDYDCPVNDNGTRTYCDGCGSDVSRNGFCPNIGCDGVSVWGVSERKEKR